MQVTCHDALLSLWGAYLHDWVPDGGHAFIKGLCDDGEAPSIGSHQRGKVCHHVDGREVICVSDLQCLQERRQTVIAKPQRLACICSSRGERCVGLQIY